MKTNYLFTGRTFIITFLIAVMLYTTSSCTTSEIEEEETALKESKSKAQRVALNFYDNLVLRWAPVHEQDIDNSGCGSMNGRGDYITAINFDNDWISTNNWNNIEPSRGFSPTAHCYYSVVETSTHYFIL